MARADRPRSDAEAARFLVQASFGPDHAQIAQLRRVGYRGWLDAQMDPVATPPTSVLAYLQGLLDAGLPPAQLRRQHRSNYWLWQATTAPDQLRLRMALALSEIFVISDNEIGAGQIPRSADYQDMLARNAFGPYRQLLRDVTLHPAMGEYLGHVGNRRQSEDGRIVPDENYAREVMQLFSIGLIERNPDFSPRLDRAGRTIATYDQATVAAMARVLTGWSYAGQTAERFGEWVESGHAPMQCHPAYHDPAPKTIVRGIVIDEGTDCSASLERMLDALDAHPNTAPFISRQLIQRFVTANPSPAYIARVAGVWRDSGGHLGQVLRAILLDEEARRPPAAGAIAGKPREPLLRQVGLWRAFNAKLTPDADGQLLLRFDSGWNLAESIGQDSLRAPSVFNFFEPDHVLPGRPGQPEVFAPEMQVVTEATWTASHNLNSNLLRLFGMEDDRAPPPGEFGPWLDLSRLVALGEAGDHAGMVAELDLLLFAGQLGAQDAAIMQRMLEQLQAAGEPPLALARSLVTLAASSPAYGVQR